MTTATTMTTTGTTTTDDERELLVAVAAASGLHLVDARRLRADAGPGGVTSGFAVTLGDATGATAEHVVYVETSPTPEDRPGVLRLRDEQGDERAVWVYPNDPYLPALADVVYPERAGALLRELGIGDAPAAPHLTLRAYRPGKRAVVEATGEGFRVFLKVATPRRSARIVRRHATWREGNIPVPDVLGATEGLTVIAAQPGDPVDTRLADADPEALLDAVDALRARIASVPSTSAARASLAGRADWYAHRLAHEDPELADRLTAIGTTIAARTNGPANHATIHGDLHVGQLFVDPDDPGRIVGVIDIDTAGLGDPADDAAAFWAHLIATTAFARDAGDEATADAAARLAGAARARWGAEQGGVPRVAAIAAAHLLGHALTRVLPAEDAVSLAEELLTEDEGALIDSSSVSHPPS